MGTPIRWDTIMSRPHSESTMGVNSAAQLLNNGFAQLQGTLKQSEDVDAANFQNHRNLNTIAFQDAVAKYRSPEDLKKALDTGELDKLRASLGPNIDANAIRGVADQRMSALMTQKGQEIAFNHAMTDEATAGAVQNYKAARVKGDQPAMDAALADYQAKNGRDLSGLIEYGDKRGWEINQRGMALENHNDQHLLNNSTIQHQRATEAAQQQANAIQGRSVDNQERMTNFSINTGTEDRIQAKAAGMAQALKSSLHDSGNIYADGVYTGNNADELRKFMKDNHVGDDNVNRQAEVINYLGEILKKGVDVKGPDGKVIQHITDIPMSAVRQAIGGATNDFWNMGWNTAPAKNMKDALESILSQTTKDSRGVLTSKALDDLRTYTDAVQRTRDNAPGIKPSGTSYPQPKRK